MSQVLTELKKFNGDTGFSICDLYAIETCIVFYHFSDLEKALSYFQDYETFDSEFIAAKRTLLDNGDIIQEGNIFNTSYDRLYFNTELDLRDFQLSYSYFKII